MMQYPFTVRQVMDRIIYVEADSEEQAREKLAVSIAETEYTIHGISEVKGLRMTDVEYFPMQIVDDEQ